MTKKFNKLSKNFLLVGYLIILVPLILHSSKIYEMTINKIFFFFVISGILFYFFRIDSTYLTFPGILLLWFCPFLIIYKLNTLGVYASIYAYYFFISSIVLQLLESKAGYRKIIYFSSTKNIFFSRKMLYGNMACAVFFIVSSIFDLSSIIKATTIYLSITFLLIYNCQFLFDALNLVHTT